MSRLTDYTRHELSSVDWAVISELNQCHLLTGFLFSILGMGMGPSEFEKSACKKGKLGKVETCLKD